MIELQSVVKRFTLGDETITALNHVDLTVGRGEFLSILGPSGSGKSTLMNILGLLDRADEGIYLFDDMDVTTLGDDAQAKIRNQKIGFVFQSFFLLPRLSALENVMVPLLYNGRNRKSAAERAEEMLARLDLADRKDHLPSQLSGGQQQRVAIARAMACEPELILADEPTGALDSSSGRMILSLMQELNDAGQTIIMITHDEKLAVQTKRMVRIIDGHLQEEGVTA